MDNTSTKFEKYVNPARFFVFNAALTPSLRQVARVLDNRIYLSFSSRDARRSADGAAWVYG